MLRTFIAACIAETEGLRALHARLALLGQPLRPVPTAQLHVTLKFLGETSKAQVPEIVSLMRRAAARCAADTWRLHGLGAFPHADRPSVVWVGLPDALPLANLAAQLEHDLAPLGFRPEKRELRPHVTVLRVKSRPPPELREMLDRLATADFGEAKIDAIELFESVLGPGGATHTPLARATLAQRGPLP